MMKKLAIVFAVSAAALMGGSSAYAADNAAKSKSSTDAAQSPRLSTDISAQHRHRHWRGHRHWHHRHYRPYYGSYNHYAPRHSYYGPRYYGGGPGITFGFGSGGYRGW
jgi:Ni/Co efflux regulator RcnB